MKSKIILFLLQMLCAAGFSQNLRFKEWGTPIPAHANLDVRWNASTNAFPSQIWVYHLLPNKFSPEAISNLMALCSFTDKDKTGKSTDGIFSTSSDGLRHLVISFPHGSIEYQTIHHYNHTNLAEGVPEEEMMPELTTNVLEKIGISIADIEKKENNPEPNFHFFNPETMYFVNHATITNIEFRGVRFLRSVDGAAFVGADTGGDGEIDFGEHGAISKISLSWRNLEHYKAYPTISPEMMINDIRQGKAVQGGIPMNSGEIDWSTIKSVTIKKAKPLYFAGNPDAPSDWLHPFAALWTTIDTGHGSIDVEIDCPIIDETKR